MTFQSTGLDALTTELWETRGVQGHLLGSFICDTCPSQYYYLSLTRDKVKKTN